MRYHLTAVRMAISKSLQVTNVEEGEEKKEPSYTYICGNANWCSHYEKQCEVSFKN